VPRSSAALVAVFAFAACGAVDAEPPESTPTLTGAWDGFFLTSTELQDAEGPLRLELSEDGAVVGHGDADGSAFELVGTVSVDGELELHCPSSDALTSCAGLLVPAGELRYFRGPVTRDGDRLLGLLTLSTATEQLGWFSVDLRVTD